MKIVPSTLSIVSMTVLLAMPASAANRASVVPAQATLDRSRLVEVPATHLQTPPARAGGSLQGSTTPQGAAATSVTILQDGFEGGFPGTNWNRLVGGPQAYWGLTTYRFFDGSHGVYCAADGTSGVAAPGPYPASMNAWMVYGPFSLADATAASATFAYWVQTESQSDYFQFAVSTDNNHFHGYQTSGDSGGWQSATLDFADTALGITVIGQPQVWFAFIFTSDASVQYEGAYVDALTITKTTGTTCTLDCSATVPSIGRLGTAVSFLGSSTANGCSGSATYDWDFGDGSAHGNQASVSHTYTAVGTYTWRMTASIAGGSCAKTGTIVISAAPTSTLSYWLPVAAHTSGLQGSQWRTDLGVLNLGSSTANLQLKFYAGGSVLTRLTTVASGAQSIIQDVVNLFSYTGSGALEVVSDKPVYVTSRTYNQASSGTFGQDYNEFTPDQGASTGQTFYLPQLTEDSSYRTNIGVTNLGSGPAAVTVELYNGTGTKLTQFGVNLAPGQWYQDIQPFRNRGGQTNMTSGYAKVTVTQGSGVIAVASVVDNMTNDPTTIHMKLAGGGPTEYWLSVAAHTSGLQGSQWRTDLGVLNLSSSTANLQLNFYGGGSVLTSSTTVASGAQSIIQDVVNLFSYTGSGALEVVSDKPVYVTSRTYNQASSGTFGQDYDSFTAGLGLSTGNAVVLPQLAEDSAYRTNIGVTNLGSSAAAVTVELYNGTGTKLTQFGVNLAAGQWYQDIQPFRNRGGQTNMTSGYAKVTVTQGSGVIAVASVVDNMTNDPTTIQMKRAMGSGVIAPISSASWVFTNILGQLGVTLPTIDSVVSTARSSGPTPMINQLAAVDPAHLIPLADGIRVDFGTGTLINGSTVTGSATITYSNATPTSNGFSTNYAVSVAPDFAINGAKLPITSVTGTVSASQSTSGPSSAGSGAGVLTLGAQAAPTTIADITMTGSGSNPSATLTGSVHFDTSVCPNYPISGTVDRTVGADRFVVTFDNKCDGSFTFGANPATLSCNAGQQVAGGDTADSRYFEMGTTAATFQFDYDTYSIQDQIQIIYEGNVIFDTSCVGASGTVYPSYSGSTSVIQVNVIPNCSGGTSGTAWVYQVYCPQ